MLVLARRVGETLMIGDEVTVTILGIKGNQVKIGVSAPKEMAVHREGTIQILLRGIEKAVEEGVINPVDEQGLLDIVYSFFSLAHGMAILQLTKLVNLEFDYELANRTAYGKLIDGFASK